MVSKGTTVLGVRLNEDIKEQLKNEALKLTLKGEYTTLSSLVVKIISRYLEYKSNKSGGVNPMAQAQGDGVNPTEKLVPYQRGVKYQPGTMVIYKGRIIRAPEIDGEGNTMPEE